jgi:hypothetical protein
MSLLGKIGRLFRPHPQRFDRTFHHFTVRCLRCGELIEGRINVLNDVSAEYGPDGVATYYCRKVLMGAGGCYQQMEVAFQFDEGRHVLEQSVSGGEFVDT